MNIQDIYHKYNIMPILGVHQLRVAAVASALCNMLNKKNIEVNTRDVITAALLHDMGNIIKFDLTYFPESVLPEGLEYWERIKQEYVQKYGKDEHIATEMIGKELGISSSAENYMKLIGFSNARQCADAGSLEQCICCYSDMRVGPNGVLSLEERLADGKKRYEGRKDKVIVATNFDFLASALTDIEKRIFTQIEMLPESINDFSIAGDFEAMEFFPIECKI